MSDKDTLEYVLHKLDWEGGWEGLYGYCGPFLNTEDETLNAFYLEFCSALSNLEEYWDSLDIGDESG